MKLSQKTVLCLLFNSQIVIASTSARNLKSRPRLSVEMIPMRVEQSRLHHAVESNDLQQVRRLIEHEGFDPNGSDGTLLNVPPIHYANSLEMIHLLVRFGADVNRRDSAGNTALHGACSRFDNDISEELLNLGADPGLLEENGHSAYCFTTEFCPPKLRQRLTNHHMCPDFIDPVDLEIELKLLRGTWLPESTRDYSK